MVGPQRHYRARMGEIDHRRGRDHVVSPTFHFSYPSNFSGSNPVSRMTKGLANAGFVSSKNHGVIFFAPSTIYAVNPSA